MLRAVGLRESRWRVLAAARTSVSTGGIQAQIQIPSAALAGKYSITISTVVRAECSAGAVVGAPLSKSVCILRALSAERWLTVRATCELDVDGFTSMIEAVRSEERPARDRTCKILSYATPSSPTSSGKMSAARSGSGTSAPRSSATYALSLASGGM